MVSVFFLLCKVIESDFLPPRVLVASSSYLLSFKGKCKVQATCSFDLEEFERRCGESSSGITVITVIYGCLYDQQRGTVLINFFSPSGIRSTNSGLEIQIIILYR